MDQLFGLQHRRRTDPVIPVSLFPQCSVPPLATHLYSKRIIANGAIAFAKVRKKNNYSNFSATFSSFSFVLASFPAKS